MLLVENRLVEDALAVEVDFKKAFLYACLACVLPCRIPPAACRLEDGALAWLYSLMAVCWTAVEGVR
jgi:hypothetical protein